MKRKLSFSTFFLPASLLLLSASCTKEVRNELADQKLASTAATVAVTQANPSALSRDAGLKMNKTDLLKSVKQATSRFHSTTQAIKAGYLPSPHCVPAMGYHWANPSLIDPVYDPLKPETILYATGPDGELRMVAIEYIVINAGNGQVAPMFGDQAFDVGGVPPLGNTPHWSLHVWLYEHNPNGMFTPFNPNISCP